MQESKVVQDFFDNIYNKEKNYKKIYSKINKKEKIKKISNVVAIFIMIITIGITAPKIYAKISWNIEYKEFENRNIVNSEISSSIVNEAQKNDMEYIYQDDIGVKIDSIILTNNMLKIVVNMKIKDYKKINSDTFGYGFAIYDEENNIYAINERYNQGIGKLKQYGKKLYRELGLDFNENDMYGKNLATTINMDYTLSKEGNIISEIELKSLKGFPKSKKIYVRIFDIGFTMTETSISNNNRINIENFEDFILSESEWQFHINLPEEVSNNVEKKFILKDRIDGIELENAKLSNMILTLSIRQKNDFEKILDSRTIYISDENGNIYYASPAIIDNNTSNLMFTLNLDYTEEKLYLNIETSSKKYKVELILEE